MSKKYLKLIKLFVCIFITINLQAQTAQLSVQGIVKTIEGNAVENGNYDITFKIYNVPVAGTILWQETIEDVKVSGGVYSVVLGAGTTALDVPFDESYYLAISIDGDIDLYPRARLTSSPYALSLIGDDNIFPNSGNVGVGDDSPQTKLSVKRGNGILGLEAIEDANNTSTITTTAEGLRFDAGGTDKAYTFNNGDINLTDGAFVFFDEANAPNTQASLDFDAVENKLNLKNEIGDIQVEGTQIILNPSDQPVEITKEGEALKLVGMDSTFISMTAQSGTNATAQFGFFDNDTLRLETEERDFVIDLKGGTTRIRNTLEVGDQEINYYYQPEVSFMSVSSEEHDHIYHRDDNHYDATAIWSHDDVAAVLFKAFSDKRIKKDFRLSDAQNDLNTLNKIEVTDYRHIDVVKNGLASRKGFIAQQLKTVFPESVSFSTQYIPSIYSLSSNIKTERNQVTITLEKPHELKVNDKVRVMVENGEEELVVQSIENELSFTVAPQKIKIKESVFVYGKEVNDFHTVDYDRVFTLAVSATQELARKVEALEKENAQLKNDNSKAEQANVDLKVEMKRMNKRLEAVELMMGAMGSK